jgi:hypothetical protein
MMAANPKNGGGPDSAALRIRSITITDSRALTPGHHRRHDPLSRPAAANDPAQQALHPRPHRHPLLGARTTRSRGWAAGVTEGLCAYSLIALHPGDCLVP